MRILTLSDLHFEFDANQLDSLASAEEFDVIAVLGDVNSPLAKALYDVHVLCGTARPVIYVPGNHDFYSYPAPGDAAQTWDQILDQGREVADRFGIHLLCGDENRLDQEGRPARMMTGAEVLIDGCRFLGGTLWSDFGACDWYPMRDKQRMAERRSGMNDYRRIKRQSSSGSGSRKPLRALDTIQWHRATVSYLETKLAEPFDGPTVVLTHHAPTMKSLSNPDANMSWAYASDLEYLMHGESAPLVWRHGHIHRSYSMRIGDTLVGANSRGHMRGVVKENENPGFEPNCILDLDDIALELGRPFAGGLKP